MTLMTDRPTNRKPRLLPPVYLLLAILWMIGLHFGLPLTRWIPWPWNLTGILPIVAGLTIVVIADRQFRRHGTTIKPFQRSSALVTDGVFRYSRHPMYLGLVVVLVGLGIGLASVTPLLVIPVFGWWLTVRFIRAEEASLVEQFGEAYLEYKRKVRRWL
jgi:protein-S-isoprenylcysteine O-methyltransferase Ste14